jgi:hypothetical protein
VDSYGRVHVPVHDGGGSGSAGRVAERDVLVLTVTSYYYTALLPELTLLCY